ncbi:hypothetical protein NDU88_001141 [Pleurodeles waltl]|uniref:Uncharacterized protein n=1 Tax=Pleurodeles waltl TaxID=8319 RepID=A0AAV7KXP3_PLEWA|nr:hypothetical protein NDU88_001141 [Pleurodeles waltl]
MGKTDKTQARLQFKRRKTISPAGEGAEVGPEGSPVTTSGEDQDLRQILRAMQHSLTQIDGKLDSLSLRMDRMSERLDQHAERLDQSERRASDVEDGQTELATSQVKLNKELSTLRLKVDNLEARSRRNNLHIVGIAESTAVDNKESFGKQLLVQLLGHATFSDLFVVERAHSELIAARFRKYYQSLYTSRVNPDPVALLDYLTHITMPQLTDTDREALMAPLPLSEMAKARGNG